MRFGNGFRLAAVLALTVPVAAAIHTAQAQTPAARYLGTVTAINGDTLTVKTDAGDVRQVEVPASAQLKRIEPGQTDLSKAAALDFSSLATGDRVLVNIDPSATGPTPQALRVIAIKKADVQKKQQTETEQWNQGVHGLVKSIDAAAGTIVVGTRQGLQTKDVTVNTTKTTVLKRYAPGSVRFDDAQPAPIGAIQTGDQLWARGAKSADGTSIAADGVVSGSFLSVAGTVLSVDAAGSTLTVKNLATKKPVTIRISADAQLRRLDSNIAALVAARLKGNQGANGRNAANGAAGRQGGGQAAGQAGAPRAFSQNGGGAGRMDLETLLERAPEIKLASLQKGEAVMIVAAEDTTGTNAIKLLAGVEPLLEAPEAQDLLSSWSLSSGASEAGVD